MLSISKKHKLSIFILIFLFVSVLSFTFTTPVDAQFEEGLVSTDAIGCSGYDCQFCNLVKGVNQVISFLVYASGIIAVCMFTWVGVKLILAQGNPGEMTKAKGMAWDVVVGFIITIAAFLIIDFLMKSFLNDEINSKWGPWNEVECGELPGYSQGEYSGGPGGPGGSRRFTGEESNLTDAQVRAGFTASTRVTSTANLGGVQQIVIDEVNRVTSECSECLVIITSARTGSHNCSRSRINHCNGYKIDISVSNNTLNAYIQSNGVEIARRSDGARQWQMGRAIYARESDHWDLVVNPASSGASGSW
jgi:hypothetical protein